MRLTYSNRYGTLTLTPVSDLKPVDSVFGKDISDADKFDLTTAEKVALITDNRGIQICPEWSNGRITGRCYLVVHETSSTVIVGRIDSLVYYGDTPAKEIQRARGAERFHVF